jgi:hypothetical protein
MLPTGRLNGCWFAPPKDSRRSSNVHDSWGQLCTGDGDVQQLRTTMPPGSMLRASVVLLAVVPKPSGTSVIE